METRFYLYRAAAQLLPIYPVYLLMFRRHGLTVPDVSLLLMVWSVPGFVLEVPSSVLADRWNRRNLMVIGRILKASCFLVWLAADGFTGYAAGFVAWGVGGALTSGTEEAWLYDALKLRGREGEFDRIWGRSHFYYQACVGIASVFGSLMAVWSMPATLWVSAGMSLVSAGVAMSLPECNTYAGGSGGLGLRQCLATLAEGVRFCVSDRVVAIMVGFVTLVLVSAGVLDEYDQLIAGGMGVPLALIGTWGFLRYGIEALGGRYAWRIRRFPAWVRADTPAASMAMGVASGLALVVSALGYSLWFLPLYAMYYLLQSAARITVTDAVQRRMKGQGRATVQSLVNMLETPTGIALYGLVGLTNRFMAFKTSIALTAVIVVLISGFLLTLAAGRRMAVNSGVRG